MWYILEILIYGLEEHIFCLSAVLAINMISSNNLNLRDHNVNNCNEFISAFFRNLTKKIIT